MSMIEPQGLFSTPEDYKVIEFWIEQHAPEERIHLYTASGMTWNLLADSVNKAMEAHTAKLNAALKAVPFDCPELDMLEELINS